MVVVGYGSMRRSDLTGSVASVRIDEDEASRSTNIGQLLQGQASGVQVVNNGGAPDGGISILVRGASSFNGSSQPLYVVDGVIISGSSSSHKMLTVGTSSDSDDTVNGLMGLNPQDIASIEILKDASATAIYGSQGANGVVLITTKTANRERPVIRFNSGVDISQVSKKAEILSFDEYSDYVYTKLQMGVAGARTAMEAMYEDADNRTGQKVYPMDWQDLAMRTAVSHCRKAQEHVVFLFFGLFGSRRYHPYDLCEAIYDASQSGSHGWKTFPFRNQDESGLYRFRYDASDFRRKSGCSNFPDPFHPYVPAILGL